MTQNEKWTVNSLTITPGEMTTVPGPQIHSSSPLLELEKKLDDLTEDLATILGNMEKKIDRLVEIVAATKEENVAIDFANQVVVQQQRQQLALKQARENMSSFNHDSTLYNYTQRGK